MNRHNVEVKYRCQDIEKFHHLFEINHFVNLGEESQTDMYFHSISGMLKLRESKSQIESGLIFYQKTKSGKFLQSEILYYEPRDNSLAEVLSRSNGILAVIKKSRLLYQQDNVRFHLDTVENLGTFIEIEVQDTHNLIPIQVLKQQLSFYIKLLGLKKADLITKSYLELISKKTPKDNSRSLRYLKP